MHSNRRDIGHRAEIVRAVLEGVVHSGVPFVTVDALRDFLQVSPAAATRIIGRLVAAGVLVESARGIWRRASL
jgi:DNA-binding MarR family transcriptional regulator